LRREIRELRKEKAQLEKEVRELKRLRERLELQE